MKTLQWSRNLEYLVTREMIIQVGSRLSVKSRARCLREESKKKRSSGEGFPTDSPLWKSISLPPVVHRTGFFLVFPEEARNGLLSNRWSPERRPVVACLCFVTVVPVIAANTRPFSVITRTPPSPRRSPLRIPKRPRPSSAGRRNDSFAKGSSARDLDLISRQIDCLRRDERMFDREDRFCFSWLSSRQESYFDTSLLISNRC